MNYRRLTKTLISKVRELEDEVDRLEYMSSYDDEDDDDVAETLSRIREQIVKGDTEYAIELIGREIGY